MKYNVQNVLQENGMVKYIETDEEEMEPESPELKKVRIIESNKKQNADRINYIEDNMIINPKVRRNNLSTTMTNFASGSYGEMGKSKYNAGFINYDNFSYYANKSL